MGTSWRNKFCTLTHRSASITVRSIVSMPLEKDNKMAKLVKTAGLNDGTQGKRFSWGLYRKRAVKSRWGISTGPTMTGIHCGKRSLYVERKAAVRHLHHFAG